MRHALRWLGPVVVFLTATSAVPAQVTNRATLLAHLNDPRFQSYDVSYDVTGKSVWGDFPGALTIDKTIDTGSYSFGYKVGGYFNPGGPFVDLTTGAGLNASITGKGSVDFHAGASIGSMDIHAPVTVFVDYPDPSTVHGGDTISIATDYYVDPAASLNINPPALYLKVGAGLDFTADVSANAQIGGDDIFNISLFQLLGLDQPSASLHANLIDTGDLTQSLGDIPFDIFPPNITGSFHVPHLQAKGRLRNDNIGSTDINLRAHASDSFFNLHADVTNLAIQYAAFGLPVPFNGDYSVGGYGITWQFMDLQADGSVGVGQDITFRPRPRITFNTSNGQHVDVLAGETAHIKMPTIGTVIITPTIHLDNSINNTTAIEITPTLTFDLFHIAGSGGDLFSFDWRPIPTQVLTDTYSIPLFDNGFSINFGNNTLVGQPYRYVFGIPARDFTIDTAARIQLGQPDGSLKITGRLKHAGFTGPAKIHVYPYPSNPSYDFIYDTMIAPDGSFSADTSSDRDTMPYGPYSVRLEIGNQMSNPQTAYILSPDITADRFTNFGPGFFGGTFDGPPPPFKPVALAADAPFHVDLGPFVHRGNNRTDEAAQGLTLLYDDTPIPTNVTTETQEDDTSSAVPVFTNTYHLAGNIPGSLMDRGGKHTISYRNGGLSVDAVTVQQITVASPVPTILGLTLLMKEEPRVLVVHGAGFTPDSIVRLLGLPRETIFVNANELRATLMPADLASGKHSVRVATPAPGGGTAGSAYVIAPPPPTDLHLKGKHALLFGNANILGDTITLQNNGLADLRGVVVTSVRLYKGTTVIAPTRGGSASIRFIGKSGGKHSLVATFPKGAVKPGDAIVVRVIGHANGQEFTLSQRLIVPAPMT